jgi:hypothetical protein
VTALVADLRTQIKSQPMTENTRIFLKFYSKKPYLIRIYR